PGLQPLAHHPKEARRDLLPQLARRQGRAGARLDAQGRPLRRAGQDDRHLARPVISVLCPTRGRRDNVLDLYYQLAPERARDVEKLRTVMEGVCMEGV